MSSRHQNKETFNSVAELYDEIRPGYPIPVLEKIEHYAALAPAAKIVEVGPGTGQASDYFIGRGYPFVGIELGSELAAYAKRKFAKKANAEFLNSSFETWDGAGGPYDLLLAAQSFHWIEADFGIRKAAEALKPKGRVALLWNLDESQNTEFWKRGTYLHDEYFTNGTANPGVDLFQSSQIYTETLRHSNAFCDVTIVEQRWQREYSAGEWIKMRNTFSPDLHLEPARRKEFHDKLRAIIEELGGNFTRYYNCYCVLAQTVMRCRFSGSLVRDSELFSYLYS